MYIMLAYSAVRPLALNGPLTWLRHARNVTLLSLYNRHQTCQHKQTLKM